MLLADTFKTLINRKPLQPLTLPLFSGLANALARVRRGSVQRIFLDESLWIHQTATGYFAYHQPYLRLDLRRFDALARRNFLWGYEPSPGDIVMEVGAGAGEETLTLSRAVGDRGRVISIEAHPRTFRCLEKLVEYNHLKNVIPIHAAVTEPGPTTVNLQEGKTYLANRLSTTGGIAVPALTIDEIRQRLDLARIHFLKMNIEGAERLAIKGMSQALRHTEVVCISCHDFLAKVGTESARRTKNEVRQFLQQSGLEVIGRNDPALPPYIQDQLWAYNPPT